MFDAFLCCDGCAESGKGTFERAVRVARWCQYRFKNILVLCSGLIFGLSCRNTRKLRLWVAERVGVGRADDRPGVHVPNVTKVTLRNRSVFNGLQVGP